MSANTPASQTSRRRDTGRPGNGGKFDFTAGSRSSATLTGPDADPFVDPFTSDESAEDLAWLGYDSTDVETSDPWSTSVGSLVEETALVDLDSTDEAEESDEDYASEPSTDAHPVTHDLAQYMEAANKFARSAAVRYRTETRTNGAIAAGDLASEGIVALREAEIAGRWPKNPAGFLRSVIASKAVTIGGHVSAEDRRALKRLHEKQQAAEQRMGRLLTDSETADLAGEVLAEWDDDRHRPSADFRAKAGTEFTDSLDRSTRVHGDESGATLGDLISAESASGTAFLGQSQYAGESAAGAAEDGFHTGNALEDWLVASDKDGAGYDGRAAWSLAYNAYAEMTGAPAVTRHLTESAAATARKTVKNAGGAAALVEKWWSDGLDEATEKSLFAPLGAIDEDGKRRFADALLRRPDGADEVWNLATRAATKQRVSA